MLYPNDIEEKLGFDKIRTLVKGKCASTLGTSVADQMRFTSNYDLIVKLLEQTNEFQRILISGDSFPTSNFIDVTDLLKKSATEGAFLSELELLDISKSLETVIKCIHFLKLNKETYPNLSLLSANIEVDAAIVSAIAEKIDLDGRVKDNATKALQDIRHSLRNRYNQVRKSMQSIYKKAVEDGLVPSGSSITVRDGRMVIPVLAEYKKRISGFIHDESSTGGTIYMEPTSILEGNNEIRELEYAEKREVIKILIQLTNTIRLNLPDLKEGYSFLGKIDFIRAKARFSKDIEGIKPQINKNPLVQWKNATHPLLKLALEKEGRAIVPLSIQLQAEERIIVISGPNAGGKSVSLKTVGLIQYMLQCGLLVPLDQGSEAGIFDNIFIDIGDEQSLENDLSTYSSHLKSMKFFIEQSNNKSLCLIDEFGTGTDPQFGGPIAEAILKELHTKKTFGVITTHYSNIKSFTERTAGLVNGAMRFDMNKLEPMFQLDVGKPGSSFSLEVARKTGLPKDLLDYAKAVIGDKNIDVDDLLMKLERQKQLVKERDEKLREREHEVKRLEHDYKSLLEKLELNKKDIISKAKEEASRLLKDTNREIEKTIRHIKANSAHKAETKKARERLQNLKDKVEEPKVVVKPLRVNRSDKPLAPGDLVKLTDQDVTATILAIKGKDAEVQIGLLKSKVKLDRLVRISKGQDKTIQKEKARSTHGLNMTDKLVNFNTTLDLRGKRAEEVMGELDRFLDDAILFGLDEVRILHGKGNGVLREVVRNHAKSQSFVSSAQDEHIDRGGAGITVINLK
ncbi:MAG TPA: endonuclease MutS2 [Fulvivirga sp.]|nr:endonuclease MutS2 [Fulvivirga sp.]